MRWVTKPKVTDLRGFTGGQIKARIQRGHWRKGIEWAEIDGVQMINLDAIDARADALAEMQRPHAVRNVQKQHSAVSKLR